MVVPPEQYRPLSLSNRDLRRLLRKGDASEVVAEAQRALDEGFPGTALHLGKELWALVPTGPPPGADLGVARRAPMQFWVGGVPP